jgi:hypothetical protein
VTGSTRARDSESAGRPKKFFRIETVRFLAARGEETYSVDRYAGKI